MNETDDFYAQLRHMAFGRPHNMGIDMIRRLLEYTPLRKTEVTPATCKRQNRKEQVKAALCRASLRWIKCIYL